MAQAERLRTTVANDPKATVPITISIGVATAKSESWHRDLSTLLTDADKALYAAKHGGRNCVVAQTQLLLARSRVPPE